LEALQGVRKELTFNSNFLQGYHVFIFELLWFRNTSTTTELSSSGSVIISQLFGLPVRLFFLLIETLVEECQGCNRVAHLVIAKRLLNSRAFRGSCSQQVCYIGVFQLS